MPGKNGKKVVSVEELNKIYQQRYDKLVEDWKNIDKLELDDEDKNDGILLEDKKDEIRIAEFEKAVNLLAEAWPYYNQMGEKYRQFYINLASLCVDRMQILHEKYVEQKFNLANYENFEEYLDNEFQKKSKKTGMIRLMIFDHIRSSFNTEVNESIKGGKEHGNFEKTQSYIDMFKSGYDGETNNYDEAFTDYPKIKKEICEKIYEYVLSTFDKGTNLKVEDLNKTKSCVDMCKSMFGEKTYEEALNNREQIREKIYEYVLSTFTKEVKTLIDKGTNLKVEDLNKTKSCVDMCKSMFGEKTYEEALNNREQIREKIYEYVLSTFTKEVKTLIDKGTNLKFEDLNKTKLCENMCKSMFGEKTYREALNSRNLPKVIKKGTDDEKEKSEQERETAENARRKELENDENLRFVCQYLYKNQKKFMTDDKQPIILFAPLRPYLRVIQRGVEAQKKEEPNGAAKKNQKINNNNINNNNIKVNQVDANQINKNRINEEEDQKEDQKVVNVQNEKQKEEPKGTEVKNEDLKVTEVKNENLKVADVENKELKAAEIKKNPKEEPKKIDSEKKPEKTQEELLKELDNKQSFLSNCEDCQKVIQSYKELGDKIRDYNTKYSKQKEIRDVFEEKMRGLENVVRQLEATDKPESSSQYSQMLQSLQAMKNNQEYMQMGEKELEEWNISKINEELESTLDKVIVYKNKKMGEGYFTRDRGIGRVRVEAASEAIKLITDLQSTLKNASVQLLTIPKRENVKDWEEQQKDLKREMDAKHDWYEEFGDENQKKQCENEMKALKEELFRKQDKKELVNIFKKKVTELESKNDYVTNYDEWKELNQSKDCLESKILNRDRCRIQGETLKKSLEELEKLRIQLEETGKPNSSERYSTMMFALKLYTVDENLEKAPEKWNLDQLNERLRTALEKTTAYRDTKVERGGWISTGRERGATRIKLAGETIRILKKLQNQMNQLEIAKEEYDKISFADSKYKISESDDLESKLTSFRKTIKMCQAGHRKYTNADEREKYASEIPKLENDIKTIRNIAKERKIELPQSLEFLKLPKVKVKNKNEKKQIKNENIINKNSINEDKDIIIDTSSKPTRVPVK